MIRYKVHNEQHPRAGLKIQHVIYEQLARAGRNTSCIMLMPIIISYDVGWQPLHGENGGVGKQNKIF